MSCFYPRTVWRSPKWLTKAGSMKVLFKKPVGIFDKVTKFPVDLLHPEKGFVTPFDFYKPEEFTIPGCSPKCVGCQEDYSRSWAVRAWHESLMYEDNCFITLTFNDKWCPKELDHRYWQLFIKRLRKYLSGGSTAKRVRYFMCGEYGDQNLRPHFHACLFGFNFSDRVLWTIRDGVGLYTSATLDKLWSDSVTGENYGFSTVGDVSFESAGYIARYVGKKVERKDVGGRQPEYSKCSTGGGARSEDPRFKGGIGCSWIGNYLASVYPDDAVTLLGGRKCKPPRFYDKKLELLKPDSYGKIKAVRKQRAISSPDNTPERLKDREKVKKAQFKQLKRSV